MILKDVEGKRKCMEEREREMIGEKRELNSTKN